MKKEQIFFLLGGFAFGIVVGYGLFDALQRQPRLDGSTATQIAGSAPSGPRAPGQGPPAGADAGAPMVAKLNELKRQLEANPQDLTAARQIAEIYYEVQMWDQSAQFYEIALGILPDDPNLLTDAGNVHRELGNFAAALDSFRKAQESDPTHWPSLFNTVVVAGFDLHQFELADAALDKLEKFETMPDQLPALKSAYDKFRTETEASGKP